MIFVLIGKWAAVFSVSVFSVKTAIRIADFALHFVPGNWQTYNLQSYVIIIWF